MPWMNELFRTERSQAPPKSASRPIPNRFEVATVTPSDASSQWTDYSIRPSTSGSDVSQLSHESWENNGHDSLRPAPLSDHSQSHQYISPLATAPVSLPSPVSPLIAQQHSSAHHGDSEVSIRYDNGYGYITPSIRKRIDRKGKIPVRNTDSTQTRFPGGVDSYYPHATNSSRHDHVQHLPAEDENDRVFSALLEETKQPMPEPPVSYEEYERRRIPFLLNSSPSVRRAVRAIRLARDTAVEHPVYTDHRFHPKEGSRLRATLAGEEVFRKAKDRTQRVKQFPKCKDVLDDKHRRVVLAVAKAEWPIHSDFYRNLNPERCYMDTFQHWRRHREGRHLKLQKIACVSEEKYLIDIKTGALLTVPWPREDTGRQLTKKERKIAKGGVKGTMLKLGKTGIPALSAPVAQLPPADDTQSRISKVSSRHSKADEPKKQSVRGRAQSVFQGKGKQPQEGGFRSRARSIFAPKGGKHTARDTQDQAELLTQMPNPRQATVPELIPANNPWTISVEEDASDPCSMSYRRIKEI